MKFWTGILVHENKYEDWCYVCGELVPEEQGIAEQKARGPGDPGWGATRWIVRHKTCNPQKESMTAADPRRTA